jgi:hypothetical protein
VTAGRTHYGPEGGYRFFAGRDASRSFVSGCFEETCDLSLEGLSDSDYKGTVRSLCVVVDYIIAIV